MGYTTNTNIELVPYDPGDKSHIVLNETIEKNAIVIFDDESGISLSVIEGLYIKPKSLIPKLVSVIGGKGGGGSEEIIKKIADLVANPSSNLYLPTIIINGFITKLTVDGTIGVLKILFKRLKSSHRRKRFRLFYYSKEDTSYFEFPSETTEEDFESSVKDIPKALEASLRGKYFTRSLKSRVWIEEDIE